MKQHVTRTIVAFACATALGAALLLAGCGTSSTTSSTASDAKPFGTTTSATSTTSTATQTPAAPEVKKPTGTVSATPSEAPDASEAPASTESTSADAPSAAPSSKGMLERAEETYNEALEFINREIEDRTNGEPAHYRLGEEAVATENLAVRVLSVEAGPYDYHDDTATVRVIVQMRNTSSRVVYVKPSNWDADNTYGVRVDHKIWLQDEHGTTIARSFDPVGISPGATFTGEVYFDGEDLTSVIYEPHWLISSQNQYIYFDL